MTSQRPPRLPELARSVAEVANAVVAAARASDREDLAAALIEISGRWSEPEVSAVLVGVTGTGKTTLLNALVGTHVLPTTGRSPVTVVRSGNVAAIQATRAGSSNQPTAIKSFDELGADVESLDVTVTDSLLDSRLTLVDSPGTLAMGEPSDSLAAALAARSDLVLVTTTAAAPIDEPTLNAVETLLDSTPNVVVAVTAIDRYRGWRTIAADVTRILDERFGERAPAVLTTSGRLGLEAARLRAERDDAADSVDEESGIPALRLRLDALVSRSRWARLRNLSHLTARVVEELERSASTTTARDPTAQLAEAHALVDTYRRRSTELPLALSDECNRIREGVVVEVRRVSTEAMTGYESRITSGGAHEEAVALLKEDLQAGQLEAASALERRVEGLTAWAMDRLDGGDAALDAPFGARELRTAAPTKRRDMSLVLRMAAAIAAGGGGLALLGTLALAGGMSGEVRLGLLGFSSMTGSFGTLLSLRHSRGQQRGTLGRLEARALVDDWQALVAAELRSDLLDAQRRLESALRTALNDRIAELERSAADQRAAAAQSASTPATHEQLNSWREQLAGYESAAASALGATAGAHESALP